MAAAIPCPTERSATGLMGADEASLSVMEHIDGVQQAMALETRPAERERGRKLIRVYQCLPYGAAYHHHHIAPLRRFRTERERDVVLPCSPRVVLGATRVVSPPSPKCQLAGGSPLGHDEDGGGCTPPLPCLFHKFHCNTPLLPFFSTLELGAKLICLPQVRIW